MTVASTPAGHHYNGRAGFIAAQTLGVIVNIATVGLTILWLIFAFQYMGDTTIGRGMYSYMPEIQIGIAASLLATTVAGLVFAALSATALTQARIYWWWAAAATVILSAIATSYFLNSAGNITRASTDLDDLPAVSSGLAAVFGVAWLAIVGLVMKYDPTRGQKTVANAAEQQILNAAWVRRFYLMCGTVFIVCGAAEALVSLVLTSNRVIDGGTAFPDYGTRLVHMSLASFGSGLAMLFFARAAGKNPGLFGKVWWLAPAAALAVCAYVLRGMDPAEHDVGAAVGMGTSFLSLYFLMSALGAAFCLIWIISGAWLQWRSSQKSESMLAFAATATSLLLIFVTLEISSSIAERSGPVTAETQPPAAIEKQEASSADHLAKADPHAALKEEWSSLETSEDKTKLDAFASRAQGTPYAELARARIDELRSLRPATAAEPEREPLAEAERLGELRRAWADLSGSNDESKLTAFISRARGTQFEASAQYRLAQVQAAAASPKPLSPSENPAPAQSESRSAELADVWKGIQDTTSEAVLEAFISQSTGTIYNVLALARLVEIRRQAKQAEDTKAAEERAAADKVASERAAELAEQQAIPEAPAIADPPTCDSLWHQRNSVFHQHRYCFQQDKALSVFGNIGCFRNQDEAWDAMGEANRQHIKRIRELESRMGC